MTLPTLLAIALTFSCITLKAQPCQESALAASPGQWKPGMKGSTQGISPADLNREQAAVSLVIDMFRKNYIPHGINVTYGGAYDRPDPDQPDGVRTGNSWYAYFYLLRRICDSKGNLAEEHETSSSVNIQFNGLEYPSTFFVQVNPGEEDHASDVFASIPRRWTQSNGIWVIVDTTTGGFQVPITRYRYLVTKDGKLPFTYMSKKEYAEKCRSYFQRKIQQVENSNRNPSAAEAAYARKSVEDARAFFGKSIRTIDAFLNTSPPSVLGESATVRNGAPGEEFLGFLDANDRYVRWVVRPDKDYYDATLPLSSPQVITAIFFIDEKQPAYVKAREEMMKSLDIPLLRSMLGKGSKKPG
jgi:hypothetical protein